MTENKKFERESNLSWVNTSWPKP